MKINQEKIKAKLKGIPEEMRSYIYDASLIIEFLSDCFAPTKFFLPEGFEPTPGMPLGPKSMRTLAQDNNLQLTKMYELYLIWRQRKDYTSKIESKYVFGLIIRHLRYYKNGWEFSVYRVGVAQIWHVGPVRPRHSLNKEQIDKAKTVPTSRTVEAAPVAEVDRFEEVEYELPEASGDPHGTYAEDY